METGKIEFMLTADAKLTERPSVARRAERPPERKGKRQPAKPHRAEPAKPHKAAEAAKPHKPAEPAKPHKPEAAKPRSRHGKRAHRHAPKKVIE